MVDLHDDTGHRPKTAQKTCTTSRTRTPGEGGHMGSVPSMHSVISVREASEDHRISGVMEGRRSPAVMPSTSARHEEGALQCTCNLFIYQ